jgi:hypothetical protein
VVIGVAALLTVVQQVISGDDDGGEPQTPAAEEIFLEPIAAVGRDPFTESTAAPAPTSTIAGQTVVTVDAPPGAPPSTAPVFGPQGGTRDISGGTPGLYGGTGSQDTCDKQRLIDFLRANPDKREAWGAVQGVGSDDVASYIDRLTPVLLRSDTRVTNHGYREGNATPKQSVLQAGTAVLIDEYGVPRARCACGNPLVLPRGVPTPRYTGDEWSGFEPANVTVIQQNTTALSDFTLVDVTTGQPYGVPVGGGAPVAVTSTTAAPAGSTTTAPSAAGVGTDVNSIVGYWTGDWGEMVLRAGNGPRQVIGVYNHDEGTVNGIYDPATRTFTGWWCETPSRAGPNDAGDVEFRFSGNSNGTFDTLDGKWRYASTGDFREDWDLRRSTELPPQALMNRFADNAAFCTRS